MMNLHIITRSHQLEVLREQTDIRRPEDLAEATFTQPYVKVNHLIDRGLYAENTARNYLNELAKLQILQKK